MSPARATHHPGRRDVLGAAAGAALVGCMRPVIARASPDRLSFDIVRKGSVIGTHAITFDQTGTVKRAHIEVKMRVGFGPITLFRYHHVGLEEWDGGQFASLTTQTDNNGEALTLQARRIAAGVEIRTGTGAVILAPAGALPLTHWNVACMATKLFNPQDGKLLPDQSRCEGADTVALADGRRVRATRYLVAGALPIEDWYDDTSTWTALRAQVKDGSVLEYRRSV